MNTIRLKEFLILFTFSLFVITSCDNDNDPTNNVCENDYVNHLNCISVIIHNPVILAITSLSKIRSPKYLRFSL
jgi:hypothetical protein